MEILIKALDLETLIATLNETRRREELLGLRQSRKNLHGESGRSADGQGLGGQGKVDALAALLDLTPIASVVKKVRVGG